MPRALVPPDVVDSVGGTIAGDSTAACNDHVAPIVHEIIPLDNVPVRPNMKTLLQMTVPVAGLQDWVHATQLVATEPPTTQANFAGVYQDSGLGRRNSHNSPDRISDCLVLLTLDGHAFRTRPILERRQFSTKKQDKRTTIMYKDNNNI